MILRNQVEWALHCCTVLATLPPEAFLSTKDLAEFHGVPKEYLSKALQALSTAGLIQATLGPRGGYQLAKAADKISFLEVVEAIEGKLATFECTEIRKNNPCMSLGEKRKPAAVCAVARVMYRADQAWRRELSATKLSDIVAGLVKTLPASLKERNAAWFAERLAK